MEKSAVLSDDLKYRYELNRIWDHDKKPLVFCMLNPSTADAHSDDPTIRRCIDFAKRELAGGIVVVNLFAYRATDPKELKTNELYIIDNENERFILKNAKINGEIILACGNLDNIVRFKRVVSILLDECIKLKCFGKTKKGFPLHPLYLKKDALIIDWEDF